MKLKRATHDMRSTCEADPNLTKLASQQTSADTYTPLRHESANDSCSPVSPVSTFASWSLAAQPASSSWTWVGNHQGSLSPSSASSWSCQACAHCTGVNATWRRTWNETIMKGTWSAIASLRSRCGGLSVRTGRRKARLDVPQETAQLAWQAGSLSSGPTCRAQANSWSPVKGRTSLLQLFAALRGESCSSDKGTHRKTAKGCGVLAA